ncbi:WD40 repeat-like protein [Dentipellis sp. KUC8613]|nr:WD40 repeat-like protein [Dentipellis sp. KUC8613]
MRVRTLEIRWHDSKPISTCDFQPVPFKKARPASDKSFARQAYRLATGGEDNHVRIWMVHPNIIPPSLAEVASSDATGAPSARPARVEYLATLSRHSAAVNVVRFSPNGELIASAGDDGMIIIWAQSSTPNQSVYGSDLSAEDMQFEKEYWKPRTTFRCTTMQVYDLAWSPTGEYLIAGSTDNAARIFSASDGKCVSEIAEHNHYVQGVAWDPLNEYIATQSSDRSMHVYSISNKQGVFEVHAVGKNSRMPHHHTRTPSTHSTSRPRMFRRESTASDTESIITTVSEQPKDENHASSSQHIPLTPATSIASTPSQSMFPPPPMDKPSSRRSSFSGSNAPSSPSHYGRYGRSPSPMPALPAIRTALPSPATWSSVRLYGDESFSNFFRRLTFSTDGSLLLTPAGQFEDPSILPGTSRPASGAKVEDSPARGRKGRPPSTEPTNPNSASSVYIYSRANFARPPIAQLPGHKKASVAVKFSPILYELRPGVVGADAPAEPKNVVLEKGKEQAVSVDVGATSTPAPPPASAAPNEALSPQSPSKPSQLLTPLAVPTPLSALPGGLTLPSPALSANDSLRALSPAISKPSTPAPSNGSVFALPYRMLYAVATMDTVAIYDTQQAGPICMFTKLHYDEFTDMSWSPDGQCLMLSSRDGYCTIVVFDEIIPAHHTQQSTLQFQSIAHQHSVPLTSTAALTPATTPSLTSAPLPSVSPVITPVVPAKRSEPSQTPGPASSSSSDVLPSAPVDRKGTRTPAPVPAEAEKEGEKEKEEPPKKKRRVALTRVGDVGS